MRDDSRRRRFLLFLLVAINLASRLGADGPPPASGVAPKDPRLVPVRDELLRRVASGELPSVVVAVLLDGTVLWEEGLGWADRAAGTAATPHTPYLLASTGKSITATAAVALAERKLLDLDRPVDAYLGSGVLTVHAGTREAVTTRRLLQMGAAVPHGGLSFAGADDARALSGDELLRSYAFVAFPAGETYLYSNLSYAVVERVLERATGLAYPALVRREVLTPLAMDDSFVAGDGEGRPAPAVGYRPDGKPIGSSTSLPRSSLGVYASVRDLLRYARLTLDVLEPGQRRPISPESVAAMQRDRMPLPEAPMALGWGNVDLGDGWRWVLSDGRAGGAQATVSILPRAGLAVVCLTNVTGDAMDALALEISDHFAPGIAERAERVISAHEAAVNRPYAPTAELAGNWEGQVHGAGDPLAIRLDFQTDGDIHVTLADQLPTLLAEPHWENGLLSGAFLGELRLAESAGHPHQVELALRPSGDALTGFATAFFRNARGAFSLPVYVALHRVVPAVPRPVP